MRRLLGFLLCVSLWGGVPAPKDIPGIKRTVRATTIERCQMIARKVSRFDSDRQVLNFLRDEARAVEPQGDGA